MHKKKGVKAWDVAELHRQLSLLYAENMRLSSTIETQGNVMMNLSRVQADNADLKANFEVMRAVNKKKKKKKER